MSAISFLEWAQIAIITQATVSHDTYYRRNTNEGFN